MLLSELETNASDLVCAFDEAKSGQALAEADLGVLNEELDFISTEIKSLRDEKRDCHHFEGASTRRMEISSEIDELREKRASTVALKREKKADLEAVKSELRSLKSRAREFAGHARASRADIMAGARRTARVQASTLDLDGAPASLYSELEDAESRVLEILSVLSPLLGSSGPVPKVITGIAADVSTKTAPDTIKQPQFRGVGGGEGDSEQWRAPTRGFSDCPCMTSEAVSLLLSGTLTRNMLRGLPEIVYVNEQRAVTGEYFPKDRRIEIYRLPRDTDRQLAHRILLHEVGHAIKLAFAQTSAELAWARLWSEPHPRTFNSIFDDSLGYIQPNAHELFAECFSMYIVEPSNLREQSPQRYACLRDHFFQGREFDPL